MRLPATMIISAFIITVFFSCAQKQNPTDKLNIFVTISPIKYFVEKIGKQYVDVSVLVPPGSSPHSYEPKPSQMTKIAQSRFFFTIGLEVENAWIPRIVKDVRNLKIIQLDSGITKLTSSGEEDEEAAHAHEEKETSGSGHHTHDGLDPHIWLSPELVKIIALKIFRVLSEADPVHKTDYQKNYDLFIDEIDSLQKNIGQIVSECPSGQSFIVFHPSWAYFAKEFNLTQIPIEIEGKEPSPRELMKIIAVAKEKNIKTIFVQPQFSPRAASQIAHEIGGTIAPANDLAENWDTNLIDIARMIGKCK